MEIDGAVAVPVKVIARVAVAPVTESVATTARGKDPWAAGVPATTPVDPFKLNPVGSVPEPKLQPIPSPPGVVVPAKVWEYAVPHTEFGSEDVEIDGAVETTDNVQAREEARPLTLSVAATAKLPRIGEFGVPDKTPVVAFKDSQTGKPAPEADQVTPSPEGKVVADSVCEYATP